MAVKIRLKRVGRKKAPIYHVVVADSRAPRDGAFIEKLGIYNPMSKFTQVNMERLEYWKKNGAQPSEVVQRLLKKPVATTETTATTATTEPAVES